MTPAGEAASIVPTEVLLVGMVLTFAGTCVTGWFAMKSHGQAKQANDAVNHQHKQPDGTPRLYDAVLDIYGRNYATEEMLDTLDRKNTRQHSIIAGKLQDHIDDELPKIEAIARVLSTMETKVEAADRTDTLGDRIEAMDERQTS